VVSGDLLAGRSAAVHAQRADDAVAVRRQRIDGKRFINEAAPYMDFAHAMIEGQRSGVAHIPCWLITDIRSFHRYVVAGHLPIPKVPFSPVPTGWKLPRRGWSPCVVKEANSFEELAAKIEVPAENLRATAERFKRAGAQRPRRRLQPRRQRLRQLLRRTRPCPTPNLYPVGKPP